jgi:hypothetical protein
VLSELLSLQAWTVVPCAVGCVCRSAFRVPLVAVLAGLLAFPSCVYRLKVAPPSELKLRLIAQNPADYLVRVESGLEQTPASDGRIVLTIPPKRQCDVYFLDLIKSPTSPSWDHKVVIEKAGKTVRTTSVNKLAKLSVDEQSYHVLKIE